MANVLIIDDEQPICGLLCSIFKSRGHRVAIALNLKDGLNKAASESFDIVFLDVFLPDGNGLDYLPKIRKTTSRPEVIIITGAGDPDGAELAVKSGAWDYIQKPFRDTDVVLQLVRALQYRSEKINIPTLPLKREGLVGSSPALSTRLDQMARAALSDVTVLFTGETGTGKELFAHALHNNSTRSRGPFVVVDCTVLPEHLVESTLFGHEKGAFTGADRTQDGLVRQADGGTLFLDEVGELPLPLQKTFLRVLQEHRFRPVGGKTECSSDFRLVAATNRDLSKMVSTGRFRQDLLFRLQTFVIDLPPLRNRMADIRELTMYHVARICERNGMEIKGFSPEFFETLLAYDWPGNVRELVNVLESAVASASLYPILFPQHLPHRIRATVLRASLDKEPGAAWTPETAKAPSAPLPPFKEFREVSLAAVEKRYLKKLLSVSHGDIQTACRISGLGRTRLYELKKKYRINH